jgi:asparagine synthase (glutamine-hydrolysing)
VTRLICGLLRFDGGAADDDAPAAMARAMTPPGLTPRVIGWADGPTALGVVDFHPPPGRAPEIIAAGAGRLLAADLRLDRPRAAAAALNLPADTDPAALALAALARWGDDTPGRLDGDYALAAWDPARRRLTLCRDVFGVRPLCFTHQPGRFFAFASLPKGLHAGGLIEPRPDIAALGRRLLSIYDVSDATGFQDISWLPPGRVMTVDADGRTTQACGWNPSPEDVGRLRISPAEAAETLRGLLEDAVACRLPAEGGVAAHLSGGLDSSAVAVLAARGLRPAGRRLIAFSYFAAPDAAALDSDRPLVEAILAQEDGVDHVVMQIRPADCLVDADIDQPVSGYEIANHANTFQIAAAEGARLLLTGAGGDEAATYNGAQIHAALLRQGRWGAALADLPRRARREKVSLARLAYHRLLRPFLPAWVEGFHQRMRGLPPPPDRRRALNLLTPEARAATMASLQPTPTWRNRPEARIDMLRNSYVWTRNTCWAVLGAAHGLAFAHPLLDRRIVDFMLSLPLERFLHDGRSRQPYRDAMAGILPDPVRFAPVKGGPLPDAHLRLIEARGDLLAATAALRRQPAAGAVIDFAAVEAAFSALPDPATVKANAKADERTSRAFAATRALSLARHLARIG